MRRGAFSAPPPAPPAAAAARQADIGLKPLLALDPRFELGWGGWQPFTWRDTEAASFERYSAGGRPTLLPIIQIILNRGVADGALQRWVSTVQGWDFERVVPAHLDAPLALGPRQFGEPFDFARNGGNEMRFCDEDQLVESADCPVGRHRPIGHPGPSEPLGGPLWLRSPPQLQDQVLPLSTTRRTSRCCVRRSAARSLFQSPRRRSAR